MKVIKEKLKRKIALAIAIVLCFNSFGAIVNDNDGSAFVTKGEFEAMKKVLLIKLLITIIVLMAKLMVR